MTRELASVDGGSNGPDRCQGLPCQENIPDGVVPKPHREKDRSHAARRAEQLDELERAAAELARFAA